MTSNKVGLAAIAGTWTIACLTATGAMAGEPIGQHVLRSAPMQSIAYDLGSKHVSGYFTRHGDRCVVALMVAEGRGDDGIPADTAARVRLILNPWQIAGFDSEEGQSINVTCGENASSVVVISGTTQSLVMRQNGLLHTRLAQGR